jgi:hypothetical protein
VTHAHAAALRHAGGVGHQHRHRPPAIVRVRRHGQNGINRAGLQQALADAGGDAGPLRAGQAVHHGGPQHAAERAEEQLVGTLRVAGAAVHPGLGSGIVGVDELARLAAALRVFAAGDAAIGAQPARRGLFQGRCPYRWCLLQVHDLPASAQPAPFIRPPVHNLPQT